jgi:nitroreductase
MAARDQERVPMPSAGAAGWISRLFGRGGLALAQARTVDNRGGTAMMTVNSRSADHAIDPLFLERWSPRAFSSEPISEAELMSLLEAARWAPSSYNAQPWRFIYARRDTEHWPRLLGLLSAYNQSWAKNAAALLILVSKTTTVPPGKQEEVPSPTHSLDAGAAWQNLALQATRSGWAAHGMAGFDRERTAVELGVPPDYRAECAIAIGRRGDKSVLPEALQAREQPSGRLPLAQIVSEGIFRP